MHAPLFAKSIHVHEIFSLLFGGDTVVRERTAPVLAQDQAAIAYYMNEHGVRQHALICDYAFANAAGAALSLVPSAVVVQAVKRQVVEENIAENLREVLNICANLFLDSEGTQVRLEKVEIVPHLAEPPATGELHAFEVQIPRYPAGFIQLGECL